MSEGLVYFITDETEEYVKIGWVQQDVYKRLLQLQTGNPRELRLLVYRQGTRQDEAKLHDKHRRMRIRGEWFRLDKAMWCEIGNPDTRGFDDRILPQPERRKPRQRGQRGRVVTPLKIELTAEERIRELALIEKILSS